MNIVPGEIIAYNDHDLAMNGFYIQIQEGFFWVLQNLENEHSVGVWIDRNLNDENQLDIILQKMFVQLSYPKQTTIKAIGVKEDLALFSSFCIKKKLNKPKVVEKLGNIQLVFYPANGRLRVSKNSTDTEAVVLKDVKDTSDTRYDKKDSSDDKDIKDNNKDIREIKKNKSKIKVLIVDDSSTICRILTNLLQKDAKLEIIGAIENPSLVEKAIEQNRPDVITLDVHMPEINGVMLLKRIFPKYHIPTIMITSINAEEGSLVFEALENGAVDYVKKPTLDELKEQGAMIIEKIKMAAEANLHGNQVNHVKNTNVINSSHLKLLEFSDFDKLIAIGSSTGGTEALRSILVRLPKQIPPIVIVQHIPPVFSKAFADRLNTICPFEVKEAEDGDEVKANRVLIAPGGHHMVVKKSGPKLKVNILNTPPVNRHCPSVDVLFNSVADQIGKGVIGLILTGMGADGAKGLLQMKKQRALTIAQDEASCVVFGMPREAIALGAADQIASLQRIPEFLFDFNRKLKKIA